VPDGHGPAVDLEVHDSSLLEVLRGDGDVIVPAADTDDGRERVGVWNASSSPTTPSSCSTV
jgi:hypothetical protein